MKKVLLSTTIIAGLLVSSAYAEDTAKVAAPVAKVKKVVKIHKKAFAEAPVVQPIVTEVKSDITPTITIGGSVSFEYGLRSQKANYKKGGTYQHNLIRTSTNYTNHMFRSKGKFIVGASAKINDVEYGASLVLRPVIYRDSGYGGGKNKTFIYTKGNFGRFELGSSAAPSRSMPVSAASIAVATGGADGNTFDYGPRMPSTKDFPAVTSIYSKLDQYAIYAPKTYMNRLTGGDDEGARKVVYYTPKINGFSAGLSFAPDVDNNAVEKPANKGPYKFKNYISAGVNYEYVVDDKTKVTVSAVTDSSKSTDNAINNIRSYEFGAKVDFSPITVAASYGTDGKSGVPVALTSGKSWKSKYWTAGVAATQDKLSTSITYLNAKAGDGVTSAAVADGEGSVTAQILSLGAEYKLLTGFTPYAEASVYRIKFSKDANLDPAIKMGNKGTVFMVGTKINF